MDRSASIILTRSAVSIAEPRADRYHLWDSKLAGFGLRVEKSGTKTFVVRYRSDGGGRSAPRRFVTVGRYGPLTVDQARRRARVLLAAVTTGEDPAGDRRTQRGEMTVRSLIELYEAEGCYVQRGVRQGEAMKEVEARDASSARPCRLSFDLGNKRISEIGPREIARGLLVLKETKTGKSIRPLGAAAVALLQRLPQKANTEFVFPAEVGEGHYQGTKRLWARAIKKAGLPGVTPHTLRHTVGSTAVSSGEALALAGAILGHANLRSTAIYAHIQYDPSRHAANRVAQRIADALAGATYVADLESSSSEAGSP
jgi:hypothetical protein